MEQKQQDKPTCAVRGMIRPGAMCGKIIVGMKYCGSRDECQHKIVPPATIAEATGEEE